MISTESDNWKDVSKKTKTNTNSQNFILFLFATFWKYSTKTTN